MSLSDDPISPTEKNQEPRETPQDAFLTLKETEASSFLSPRVMSQERHETFPYSVPSMNTNEVEEEEEEALNSLRSFILETPNYFPTTNTGDLQNPSGNFGFGSWENIAAMSSRRDIANLGYVNNSTNNDSNNGHSSGEGCSKNSSDVFEYQRNFPLGSGGSIASITSQSNNTCLLQDSIRTRNPQVAYDNFHHSIMQGNGYETNSCDTFGYQSDFSLGSEEEIAAMSSLMLPIPGFVNTNTTNDTNNDQLYISTEGSNNSGGFLEEPMTRDTGCQKTQNTNSSSSPLSHQQQQPQWTIKKILTRNDVRTEYIVLKRCDVVKHTEELIPRAKGSSGVITINVYDQDKTSKHTLHLEFGRSYVYLRGNWKKDFVKRRELMKGDEIGFCWDSSASMLQFSVLSREIRTASAEEKKSHQQQQPQWTIKKILTRNDVRTEYIVLKRCDVVKHTEELIPRAKGSSGVITINVYDQDLTSKHTLHLELGRPYVYLRGNWKEDFVKRRELMEGEEIGFFWDSSASMLQFSVISREIRKASAEEKKV